MTILLGDSGKVAVAPFKKTNFNLATPRENNITLDPSNTSFATSLPTSQTTGIGASFTIQNSDLPVIDGMISTKYTAFLVVSGKNLNGATQNVISQSYKNGIAVGTQATLSTPNNNFWTHTFFRYFDVVVGDVLEATVWAGGANVSYDYCGLFLVPTQLHVSKSGTIMKDLTFSWNTSKFPTFTANQTGSTLSASINTQSMNLVLIPPNGTFSLGAGGTQVFGTITHGDSTGFLRTNNGDATQSVYSNANATNRNYARIAVPETITFREVIL